MIAEQAILDDAYREEVSRLAAATGMGRSRTADADGFDEALGIIRELAQSGEVFSANDARPRQLLGSPAVLGAAFARARREGWIEAAGTTTARAIQRHGSLTRTWRGVSPP